MNTSGKPLDEGAGLAAYPRPHDPDPKEKAFCRFAHLQDCRHFNLLCGNDLASRAWERENGPELRRLAQQYPDFDARLAQYVLHRTQAALKREGELAYWKNKAREHLSEYRRRKRH